MKDKITTGAERMSKAARLAALNAQDTIMATIEDEYGEEEGGRAVASAATAAIMLFSGAVGAAAERNDQALACMMLGMFNEITAPMLTKLARIANGD